MGWQTTLVDGADGKHAMVISLLYSGDIAQRIRGGVQRVARALRRGVSTPDARGGFNEATTEARHVARRDAGWVQVLGVDAQTVRGRGQLMMWGEQLHPGGTIDARLESYTPAGEPLHAGEDVLLAPEKANEHYPARVRSCENGAVVVLDWPVDELPAQLRELGGD